MVTDVIKEKYDSLSKTHKLIASYVIKNERETSYISINELSRRTGASEATIVRFCNKIGFEGYPEFKTALRGELSEKDNITERLRESYKAYEGRGAGIVQMFQDEAKRIERTLDGLNMDVFFDICDEIVKANKIYILASRSARSLGLFFQYYLNMTLGNVVLISEIGCDADQLYAVEETDVVIGITFARYTKSTVKLFEYAKKKNAKTIAITDSPISPLVNSAEKYLIADTSMPTYIDSFVAPLAIINAILAEIGLDKNEELEKRISELSDFHKEHDIF